MTDDERDLDQDMRDLRMLDPAHDPRPDVGREDAAAQTLLARILDTPQGGSSADHVARTGERRRGRHWAAGTATAAAVAAGVVILSPWGTSEHAFATWTAAPHEVPADALDELGAQCTNQLAADVLGQEVVITEERGEVTFVVTATPRSLRYCLLVDGEKYMTGGGSAGGRGELPEVAPSEVQTSIVGGGGHEEDAYTAVIGRVGEDVVGVEVLPQRPVADPGDTPAEQLPESVIATVDNGFYGAWWPSGPGEPVEVELTVQLADGTTTNVPAFDYDR